MSKTTAVPIPQARLQADDANHLDNLALWLDHYDRKSGNPNNEVQTDLRRIARYLRETFPNTINQPTTPK